MSFVKVKEVEVNGYLYYLITLNVINHRLIPQDVIVRDVYKV